MTIRRTGFFGVWLTAALAALVLTAAPAWAGGAAPEGGPRAGPGPWGAGPRAWWQRGGPEGPDEAPRAWAKSEIGKARHRAIARKVQELRARAMRLQAAGDDAGAAEAMRWAQVLRAADRAGFTEPGKPGRAGKGRRGPQEAVDHARPDRKRLRQRLHQPGKPGPGASRPPQAGDPRVHHVREAVQHLRAAGLDVMAERVMRAAMEQVRIAGGPEKAPGMRMREGKGRGMGMARPPIGGDQGPRNRGPGKPKAWKGPRPGNADGRGLGPMGLGMGPRGPRGPMGPGNALRPDGPPPGSRRPMGGDGPRGKPEGRKAEKAPRKGDRGAERPSDDLGQVRAEMAALRRQIEELRRLVKQASESR